MCIFCKIVNKEINGYLVDEDNATVTFLDTAPLNKGHCLVIPKKHYEDLIDVPYEELMAVMKKVKQIAQAMKEELGADGVNVFQNNGKAAGQVVFHIHFHVVPRFENDEMNLKNWKRKKYDREEDALEIAKRIRKGI